MELHGKVSASSWNREVAQLPQRGWLCSFPQVRDRQRGLGCGYEAWGWEDGQWVVDPHSKDHGIQLEFS